MKQGEKGKLAVFLQGIESRMTENRDFFSCLDMTFVSGRKTFSASLHRTQSGWELSYQGQKTASTVAQALAYFAGQAEKYEEATLIYGEGGKQWEIHCTARGVQMKQTQRQAETRQVKNQHNPLLGDRQYYIPVDDAQDLLRAIGILTRDGKLKNDKIRKYNQIDHYVELVAPFFQAEQGREILLLDCACGKSYLSFVLNYYITYRLQKKCRVIGVDYSPGVIESSRAIAEELGYHNMEFIAADLRAYTPPAGVTAVISLHACDIATDLALITAVRAGARYIACVPCCHKELLEQYRLDALEPLLRQGVFRARMNDLLTDSMRALWLESRGYRVSAVEYISPLDTPKNLLIRAEKTEEKNPKAADEYQKIRRLLSTESELDRWSQIEALSVSWAD